jgi:hypothetical protein
VAGREPEEAGHVFGGGSLAHGIAADDKIFALFSV